MNDLNLEIKTELQDEKTLSLNRIESSNNNEDPFLNINESSLTIWEVILFNPEYFA
jgi:hypothetical protein